MLTKEDPQNLAAKLEAVIETAIDGIITIDERGRVESVNKAAANHFGYDRDEIVGKNIAMLMPEPYRSEHDGYMHRYQKTRIPHIIGIGREVTGKRKDGSLFPFRLAVSEVVLHNRVIYTGIIHDLSEVKRAEAELVDLTRELETRVQQRTNELEETVNDLLKTKEKLQISLDKEKDLNELKSRFVSMASHEFRTPLSTILSSISLVEKYNTISQPEKQLRHVEKIKAAVGTLTGILNDFLSLSKIEEGKIDVTTSVVDIDDLLQSIEVELESLLKGHQMKQLGRRGVKLVTDSRILKNILFNLLSNAVKYSPPSSEIRCVVEANKNRVHIRVEDEGMGIPESDQKHIFSRFFRAENAINIQGTGLGLNIVKRYVTLLQGKVHFSSEVGKGTTFYLEFPINVGS